MRMFGAQSPLGRRFWWGDSCCISSRSTQWLISVRLERANRALSEAARKVSISTKLNFAALSTQINHLQLARPNPFRLILRWIRVSLCAERHSC